MFSCSEFFKACDTNSTNRIQPQQVPQQGLQYQQPPLRQDGQPAFANQAPYRAAQTAYAEEKAISAGLQPVATMDQNPVLAPSPSPPMISEYDNKGMQSELEKLPASLAPEQLELGPAPSPPTYQLPEGGLGPTPVAPPAGTSQPWERGPDLKEPEPEETIEYNASYEFKKAALGAAVVATCFFGGLFFLFMNKEGFEEPVCPEEDWYKLNGVDAPRSCEPCGSGPIVLPLGGEWEKDWPREIRAVLYFLCLGWCFLGIAIVCDQFMAAIEEVTSQSKVVWVKVHGDTKHKFHKKIWNDTVANLTLMALGSSAPEILLSVIELVGNSFFAGELGPSTIVGSAAFNLLVITAVCVAAIPAPDIRKIYGLAVFAVTASLSIFAYVWLIIILQLHTPDVVDKEEAFLTFGFFPMLVILAFLTDKGYFGRLSHKSVSVDAHIYDEQTRLQKQYSKNISFETVKMMLEETVGPQKPAMTKAQYRRRVMKSLVGGAKGENLAEVRVGFDQAKFMCLECAGTLNVPVRMTSRIDGRVEVRYYTQDGLALAGKRYTQTEGTFVFEAGDQEKIISIPIIDNEVWEEQEDFIIVLENLNRDGDAAPSPKIDYGFRSTRVIILNDDEPGTLCFFVDEVKASREADTITIGVSRINGSTGRISCSYTTVDDTAVAGSNYTATEGEMSFEDGVVKNSVEIGISPLGKSKVDRCFRVKLFNPSTGVKFDIERDGGADQTFCDVILPGIGSKRSMVASFFAPCMCDMKVSSSIPDWKNQFVTAFYCNGTPADQSGSSRLDWTFHLLSMPWKISFAFIPPAQMAGGWACFCSALGMIGAVTMIVGDAAAAMGCCIGIPDDVTAITIVALGTSLPDTLASKSAAMHDPSADNSIGNVTGSNCVNVFLGLGLPWSVGAMYWEAQGKTPDWIKKDFNKKNYEETWGHLCPKGCFLVPAGNLAFSVTVFTITAVACVALLIWRRYTYGGELGGPAFAAKRDASIMVFLWLVYIVMSILKSLAIL